MKKKEVCSNPAGNKSLTPSSAQRNLMTSTPYTAVGSNRHVSRNTPRSPITSPNPTPQMPGVLPLSPVGQYQLPEELIQQIRNTPFHSSSVVTTTHQNSTLDSTTSISSLTTSVQQPAPLLQPQSKVVNGTASPLRLNLQHIVPRSSASGLLEHPMSLTSPPERLMEGDRGRRGLVTANTVTTRRPLHTAVVSLRLTSSALPPSSARGVSGTPPSTEAVLVHVMGRYAAHRLALRYFYLWMQLCYRRRAPVAVSLQSIPFEMHLDPQVLSSSAPVSTSISASAHVDSDPLELTHPSTTTSVGTSHRNYKDTSPLATTPSRYTPSPSSQQQLLQPVHSSDKPSQHGRRKSFVSRMLASKAPSGVSPMSSSLRSDNRSMRGPTGVSAEGSRLSPFSMSRSDYATSQSISAMQSPRPFRAVYATTSDSGEYSSFSTANVSLTPQQVLLQECEHRRKTEQKETRHRTRLQASMQKVMDRLLMTALCHRQGERGLHPSLQASLAPSVTSSESLSSSGQVGQETTTTTTERRRRMKRREQRGDADTSGGAEEYEEADLLTGVSESSQRALASTHAWVAQVTGIYQKVTPLSPNDDTVEDLSGASFDGET